MFAPQMLCALLSGLAAEDIDVPPVDEPAQAAATDGVPDETKEVGAQAGIPEAIARPAADRIREFKERALTLGVNTLGDLAQRNKPGSVLSIARPGLVVMEGAGEQKEVVADQKLLELTEDDDLEKRYQWTVRNQFFGTGLRIGACTLCFAGPVAGLVLGGVIGAGFSAWSAAQTGLLATALVPLGIGLLAGGLGGAAIGVLSLLPSALAEFAFGVWDFHLKRSFYSGVIHDYNKRLADELGLDPRVLGMEYFPNPEGPPLTKADAKAPRASAEQK